MRARIAKDQARPRKPPRIVGRVKLTDGAVPAGTFVAPPDFSNILGRHPYPPNHGMHAAWEQAQRRAITPASLGRAIAAPVAGTYDSGFACFAVSSSMYKRFGVFVAG